MSINVLDDVKFFAKIALGVRDVVFGKGHGDDPFASKLRALLHAGNLETAEGLLTQIPFKMIWGETGIDNIVHVVREPGFFVLTLTAVDAWWMLHLYGPERAVGWIAFGQVREDSPRQDSILSAGGLVFVFSPVFNFMSKPIPFAHWLAHRLGNARIEEIANMCKSRLPDGQLPPYDFDRDYTGAEMVAVISELLSLEAREQSEPPDEMARHGDFGAI